MQTNDFPNGFDERWGRLYERFDLRESHDEPPTPSSIWSIDDLRHRNLDELIAEAIQAHTVYRRRMRMRLIKKVAMFGVIILISLLTGISIGMWLATHDINPLLTMLQFIVSTLLPFMK
jgi:hypothetical protein